MVHQVHPNFGANLDSQLRLGEIASRKCSKMGSWRVKVVLKKEEPDEEEEVSEENFVEIEIKEEIGEDPLGGEEEDHDDLKETKEISVQEPRKKWSRRKPTPKMCREEYLRRKRERERMKREAETPEQRADRQRRDRESYRKCQAKLKEQKLLEKKRKEEQDPRTEEEKREMKKLARFMYNHARYCKQGRVKDMTEEERQKRRDEERAYRQRKSEGEKREEYRRHENAKRKRYYDKKKAERPEEYEKRLEVKRQHYHKYFARESAERKAKRILRGKVNGAKFRLKRKLKKEGVSEEEIERRCDELGVAKWKELDPEGKFQLCNRNKLISSKIH